MAEEEQRRIELVAETDNSKREAFRVGTGLMVGLILGRNSLFAAANGSEQFEFAIAHFVGLVLASVAGALLLGTIYDRSLRLADKAAAAEAAEAEAAADTALETTLGAGAIPLSTADPSPFDSATELPPGMPT